MSDAGTADAQCTGSNLAFEVPLAVVSTSVWWIILLGSSVYAFLNRKTRSRGWNLYKAILIVIQLYAGSTCWYALWISTLGSNKEVTEHLRKAKIFYEVYIFFNNVTTAGFLGLLLLCSAGYCITRSDLGEHASRVVFIPVVLLVCGLVSDYIWFNYQKYPQEWCPSQYQIRAMDPLASAVWFLTAVMKLGGLLLAWIYIFDILTIETRALEATYKRYLGPMDGVMLPSETQGVAPVAPHGGANGLDVEAEGADEGLTTVFDHVAYNTKRTLMSRFALTVSLYLITAVCVLLTPVVDTKWVQYTITGLNEGLKWVIVAVLAIIFRPVASNPYLMLGDPATGDLTTELGMLDGEDDDISGGSPASHQASARKPSQGSLQNGDVNASRDQLPLSTSASHTHVQGGMDGQFSLVDDEELEEIKLMERSRLSSQLPR